MTWTTEACARTALETVDWRRRVFELYQQVRDTDDPQEAHHIWREGRNQLFATHPASPLLAVDAPAFAGLDVADYDPQWRFRARIEQAEAQTLSVTTGTDGTVVLDRIGLVRIPEVGTLDVWRHSGYGGGLFLPVKDGAAGAATYGGGRYLLDTIKGADLGDQDGHLILDLNFAYNPSCAYDPEWACPLAQPGNRVDVAVPVGERRFESRAGG